jgi:hypothetical protein
METELQNVSATASKLGVTQKWLLAQAEAGIIPSLLIGRKRLFNVEAVRAALAELAGQPHSRMRRRTILEGTTDAQ